MAEKRILKTRIINLLQKELKEAEWNLRGEEKLSPDEVSMNMAKEEVQFWIDAIELIKECFTE